MGEAGLLLACRGCCCGHSESGGPKTPPRTLRAEIRRAHREAGLEGRLRLAFTDCLGPCSEANVLFLHVGGRGLWLRRMNARPLYALLFAWLRAALVDPAVPLPATLDARAFRWAGGGAGPEPPIEDGPGPGPATGQPAGGSAEAGSASPGAPAGRTGA